jgi:3-methyl-2-oxobutanoate hydroxymethyltransferase
LKKTVLTFKEAKKTGKKLTMLTAYDYSAARLIDPCGIDAILVGDSLGMVCLGYPDTLSVTMEDMLHHTRAVARGADHALLISDLPFMSYQASVYDAVKNAGRLVQEGRAEAVKIEGGGEVAEQAKAIVRAQIPVMGHIGLTPQSVNMFGGFKVQGKERERAKRFIEDAKRLEDAGVFSIVLECIPGALADIITQAVSVPTIGIGAGNRCDGQVLVYQDMLGMLPGFQPKFVKAYENLSDAFQSGVRGYIEEVENGKFPSEEHTFLMDAETVKDLIT